MFIRFVKKLIFLALYVEFQLVYIFRHKSWFFYLKRKMSDYIKLFLTLTCFVNNRSTLCTYNCRTFVYLFSSILIFHLLKYSTSLSTAFVSHQQMVSIRRDLVSSIASIWIYTLIHCCWVSGRSLLRWYLLDHFSMGFTK